MTGDVLDTIINVVVLVFIGCMIWLYVQKTPGERGDDR